MSETKPVAWGAWSDFEQRVIAATTDQMKADTYDGVGDITIIPLCPASALTSLMEENERLKAAYENQERANVYLNETITETAARAQAAEKACDEWSEVSQRNYQRAKAAEQRVKDAVKVLEQQSKALEPLANSVFNDNGDISVNYPVRFTSEHCIAAYFADRAARAFIKEAGE